MKDAITIRSNEIIRPPRAVSASFNRPLAGLLWLPNRVRLGCQWLAAGLHELETWGWKPGALSSPARKRSAHR